MKPGRYTNLSNTEYHASPGISSSGLKELAKSPKHYQMYISGPRKQTPSMLIGSAVHSLVLEPDVFPLEFAVSPECRRGSKEWIRFEQDNPGKNLLKPSEYEQAVNMRDSICSDVFAVGLLSCPGAAEHSLYWMHDLGILCKCRPDFLTDNNLIVDIKTSEDASPEGFERAIGKWKYHISAAFYTQGVEAVTGRSVKGFSFLVVENEPPYLVAYYLADNEMLERGNLAVERYLNRYKECTENNHWPGFPKRFVPISCPSWAI